MFYCSFIEECLKFRYNDFFSTIFQTPSYISKCNFLNHFLRRVYVLQLNRFPFLMTSSHYCNNKPNCGWNYRWLIQVKMSSGEKEDVADYILRNNNSVFFQQTQLVTEIFWRKVIRNNSWMSRIIFNQVVNKIKILKSKWIMKNFFWLNKGLFKRD